MNALLTKGQSVNLTKEAPNVTKFQAGAGWNPKASDPVDLDLTVILLGADGKALPDANSNNTNLDESVVFYNNKTLPGFQLSEDDRTGDSSDGGDDEICSIDTTAIQAEVQRVLIAVGSYTGQSFGEVEDAYARLVDDKGGEVARVNLGTEHSDKKAVVIAELSRDGSDWKFANMTEGYSSTEDMLSHYGVTGL